uniref:C2H2-type domain-containing protein n=1 Tax=Anopheles coluzzii TaxID=1518534 RepID=A0A6E8VT93_ANOCL|nr:ikaros family zinc finger protein-like [Anopheles coluzzii]XP_040230441.2 ikaros family zinc finger protein-like [Anopheles coluzzii]XP_040230443.2 ikaros family zinc finger protein-like [Anopheles coluzzii]XP_049462331.1 ikaros family zinc finger protein-like [Anopheles coluzzii]
MDVAPSMVQRSGDKLIVRRVVSGEQVHLSDQNPPVQSDDGESTDQQLLLDRWRRFSTDASANYDEPLTDGEGTQPGPSSQGANDHDQQQQQQQQLPQCKIKRNYSCGRCTYFTQNPRKYLTHLRDTHGEKIVINECKRCLYASRHYQKLVRHMKMVHGSVDGIRKSAFGASRRRVQKSYGGQMHLGQVMPAAVPKLSDSEALTTAYVQQLVASGLPKLLEEMEKSGAALAANFAREASTIKVELDQLKQSMPYTSDETVQEVNEGDRIDSKPSEEPKKRSRPVPNLIPLNMSTSGSSAKPKTTPQKFVKPIPIAALKAENGESDRTSEDYPLSLTKHQQPVATHPDDIMTKCMYCELSFKPVEALANHIKLAHKNDLIAFLLANSFDNATDAADKPVPQHPAEPTERTTVNEIWKRLLERSAESSVQTPRKYEAGGSSGSAKDLSNDTDTDDDNREDSHQSQTFCGVETAPGYGEVTNRLPTIDPSAVGRTGSGGSSGGSGLMKKVFKCPHCSFWASTASRFHVHIVGHLNKKPFECSLCAYRSNWRWDITKHIRLKTIRDPSHKNAGVLMNDETGRRNYTKYNKYIALMQITDK